MSSNKNPPRFAFLLGAGASVDAGLPTLTILTDNFVKHLETANKYLFQSLKDILSGIGSGEETKLPDVETLLGNLERILELRHPLLLKQVRDAAIIQHELRKFIWENLRQSKSFDYLDSLRKWLTISRPMDIFSLNNDLVVESWCENMGLSFSDGFDQNRTWSIGSLESTSTDVRLHKIHGSINWFRDKNTDLLKSEKKADRISLKMRVARTPVPDTALLFPAHTKDLLYPPLLQLFNVFYRKLCEIDVLFIIGCQLKDVHINRAIKHALVENAQLHVLIVDPKHANEIADRIVIDAKEAKLRISAFPQGFGSFLQSHPDEVFESLFAIQQDTRASLKNVLSQIQQNNAPDIFIKAAEDYAKKPSFAAEEKTAIQQIVEATLERPKEVNSPLDKVLRVLHEPTVEDNLEKRLRDAAEMLKTYRAPSCYGIYCDKNSVWVVSGQTGGLIRYDPTNWKSVNFDTKLINPRGMTFYNNTVYIIECSFRKIEGCSAPHFLDTKLTVLTEL